jgi:hypothetical protein
MLQDKSLFHSFTKGKIRVNTGNPSAPLTAEGYGSTSIFCQGCKVILDGCLFVPSISQQLISMVQLLKTSVKIIWNGDSFKVETDSSPLFVGKIKENLLFVSPDKPSANLMKGSAVSILWHQHLGHPGKEVLKSLRLSLLAEDCNVCACSKMSLLPFSIHFSPALFPLHCIHLDLVRPVNPGSVSGFCYFLTCVDQFSSFKMVCFLKNKSKALQQLKNLLAIAQNTHNTAVKEIASDRGGICQPHF